MSLESCSMNCILAANHEYNCKNMILPVFMFKGQWIKYIIITWVLVRLRQHSHDLCKVESLLCYKDTD